MLVGFRPHVLGQALALATTNNGLITLLLMAPQFINNWYTMSKMLRWPGSPHR